MRVSRPDGTPLPAAQAGDIQVREPNVFKGYWRMPEKMREEITADGWFRTGDIGQWDADGYFAIGGRFKDLITSGRYNVYPQEVETVLDHIPGGKESAVIGVPHANFGGAVTAVVVAERPCALSGASAAAKVTEILNSIA